MSISHNSTSAVTSKSAMQSTSPVLLTANQLLMLLRYLGPRYHCRLVLTHLCMPRDGRNPLR